jgi:ESCRT-II complex subunit VPS22
MHRLGGAGLAAFERERQTHLGFSQLSSELARQQLSSLQARMTQFRTALQAFAAAHRDEIARDPHFRREFARMCAAIGVDPLAGPRRGGWWADLLGNAVGDWQHELGVQIVDVCVSTRERNGGLIAMDELLRVLRKLRGVADEELTEEDVARSVKVLQPLGAGYAVVDVGGVRMVRSVSGALDEDQAAVLAFAQKHGGRVREQELADACGWTRARAHVTLENMLLREGTCWLDTQDEYGRAYWIPASMTWDE